MMVVLSACAYMALLAFAVCRLAMPAAVRLSQRTGAIDRPGADKIHLDPTPLLGGLAMLAGTMVVIWAHLLAAHFLAGSGWIEGVLDRKSVFLLRGSLEVLPRLSILLGGALAFAAIGFLDDIWNVSARLRLWLEFAVAFLVVAYGIGPRLVFLPHWLAVIIGVFWIVGVANAMNFIDGLDGLAGTICLVSALTLGVTLLIYNQPMVALLLFALAGAVAGFLASNLPPARVFMGSTGSLFLGYMLAASSVSATLVCDPESTVAAIFMPLMLVGVPLYNMLYVIVHRFREGVPIVTRDTNHLHHRLLRLNLSAKQSLLLICLFHFVLSVNSMLLIRAQIWEAAVIFVQIVATTALFFFMESIHKVPCDPAAGRPGPGDPPPPPRG